MSSDRQGNTDTETDRHPPSTHDSHVLLPSENFAGQREWKVPDRQLRHLASGGGSGVELSPFSPDWDRQLALQQPLHPPGPGIQGPFSPGIRGGRHVPTSEFSGAGAVLAIQPEAEGQSAAALLRSASGDEVPNLPGPQCQVAGCRADLNAAREYHRRHRVCEVHAKTPTVLLGTSVQRFCQQCSR